MDTILKKNKSMESLINEYMSDLVDNCEKNRPSSKKNTKVRDENVIIPTVNNYEILNKYNYNLAQLKKIAKNYKIKISGNKNQLTSRVYSYLYFSSFIIKIQKIFRGQIARKYKASHGPAALNRKLCTNAGDFITMEPVENINFHQFLSYRDEDGFVYGFDIISLHMLYLKSKDMDAVRNPYNRNLIPEYVIKTIKSIIRLSRILQIHINMHYDEEIPTVSNEKAIELRALGLFQAIDALGNYSDPAWFLSLNRPQLVKFVRELADIWNYRAQITNETKRNICPPVGDPFRSLVMQYIYTEDNIWNVKTAILEVLEKFVNSGIDNDSKSLGACYILGSLTLVNESAATSLPWLYQSFGHF
jgi:hypothetical protein